MSGGSDSINKVLESLFDDWSGKAAKNSPPDSPALKEEGPEMSVSFSDGERGEVNVSVPRDPKVFREVIDKGLGDIESLLGLEAGQSRWTVPPSYILSEREISRQLEEEPEALKIKPDQADPILGRLPDYARAGEIAHHISPVPALARLERLQEVGDTLRERGDVVIRRKILGFMVTPTRVFAETSKCTRNELLAFSDLFDDWVNTGMSVLSGPHGHWDRKGRWPSCLLLLQAMSVACGAATGDANMRAEMLDINQQLKGENFGFLWKHIRKYHQALGKLDIEGARNSVETPMPEDFLGDDFMVID
jgi:hypothetical protein